MRAHGGLINDLIKPLNLPKSFGGQTTIWARFVRDRSPRPAGQANRRSEGEILRGHIDRINHALADATYLIGAVLVALLFF